MGLTWTTVVTSKDTDNHITCFYRPWAWNQRAWSKKRWWAVGSTQRELICWVVGVLKEENIANLLIPLCSTWVSNVRPVLPGTAERANKQCMCVRGCVLQRERETLRSPIRIRKHAFLYMQTKSEVSLCKEVNVSLLTLKSHFKHCCMRRMLLPRQWREQRRFLPPFSSTSAANIHRQNKTKSLYLSSCFRFYSAKCLLVIIIIINSYSVFLISISAELQSVKSWLTFQVIWRFWEVAGHVAV